MKQLLVSILLFFAITGNAQTWMGERITNSTIYLDPTEIQMFGSITGLLAKDVSENQYLPFGVGASQSIYSKQLNNSKSWEVLGEMAVFTQFEWKSVDGSQQRNLVNIDYKIAFTFIKQLNEYNSYRIRGFHVSSHLGDDYLIRNQERTGSRYLSYTENKVNYEQLEFAFFHQLNNSTAELVAGVGSVIRPNALRLPFSYLIGIDHVNVSLNNNWSFTNGILLKGFQETDFDLNLKVATGFSYLPEHRKSPVRLLVEYYTGHLPYSQYEDQKTEWLGLGLYFTI